MYSTLLTSLLLIHTCSSQNDCVFLKDCADATQYQKKRGDDPETKKMLQKVNCGFEVRANGRNESKVYCNRVPKFDEKCVYTIECPAAVELLENHGDDPKTDELLRNISCGYSEQLDMIHCYKIPAKTQSNNRSTLLPTNCGPVPGTDRLFGGSIAELNDYPWMALLKNKTNENTTPFFCHGSLISEKYVVTAAHCIYPARANIWSAYTVVLGEYNTNTTIDCPLPEFSDECNDKVQEFRIESVEPHPNFEIGNGLTGDFALIRLQGRAKFTKFVQPICLALDYYPLKDYQILHISGWGRTEKGPRSAVKLKARIQYLPKLECKKRINYDVLDNEICAGSQTGANDTCSGDSGGPLMAIHTNKGDSKTILVGVVSWGKKCGSRAAIYSNTTFFASWLLKTIKP